ncbi:MAG: bifunctional phosphopantothenoylcysteine decarboxylase/phosphopantothenate--cysteine ligase CoaBC [Clostridiales bacterium]|nr:bifunctional phosphopantothenoylcysteine decarboxylase/phosphopantothenate--cysteine ligase CoaBC [Clostridiales bacterium]
MHTERKAGDKPCVVLGVTGGIAAYKACEILRILQKNGCDVFVVMTKNACRFLTPLTFETLSGHPVAADTFERPATWEVEHVALAKRADIFLIAPATANVLAKMAAGIADDMLTTTVLATEAPILVAPAMNTGMYKNAATQDNCVLLKKRGVHFVAPVSGHLACGDEGEGKLASPEAIAKEALQILGQKRDLAGLRVAVTAGPTREKIDPVRYLSNRSSGRMGYALAARAMARGADVTLLTGPVSLTPPAGVSVLSFGTTKELLEKLLSVADRQDVIIQAAAPGDFCLAEPFTQKIKKKKGEGELVLRLTENPDVAAAVGSRKREGQILVGFAAETEHVSGNAREKLKKKNLDLIVANDVTQPGAGFDVETNIVTLITEEGEAALPLLSKDEVADRILDRVLTLREKGKNPAKA